MTTDNKRDPNDVLREWAELSPVGSTGVWMTAARLAAALRDARAENAMLQERHAALASILREIRSELAVLIATTEP